MALGLMTEDDVSESLRISKKGQNMQVIVVRGSEDGNSFSETLLYLIGPRIICFLGENS
jgi:hypothetical protein